MELLGYFSSLFIGLSLGLLGGGGSILAIPILVYLFKLDPVIATAYSLFIVGSTSLIGVISKHRLGLINFNKALLFGVPSLLAVFFTRRWIVPAIPDIIINFQDILITKRVFLLGLFAVLMIATSFSMIRNREDDEGTPHQSSIFQLTLLGLVIGVLTGLVGAGGGFLIIPALVLLAGLSMKEATGTSLFIIAINSLIGFTGDIFNLEIHWYFLLSLSGIALAGTIIGGWLMDKIKGTHLRKSFGWFTLAMGCWILVEELFIQ